MFELTRYYKQGPKGEKVLINVDTGHGATPYHLN